MSTVPPPVCSVAERRARHGRRASSTRRCPAAAPTPNPAQLTIMVGGDAAALERARPVLDALAKRVFHLGALGTGAAMKLAVNTVIFGLNEALAEGLVLAERAGIDRALAYDVFAASAAGAPYVEYKRADFLDPEGDAAGVHAGAGCEGLGLITRLGRRLDVPVPQAARQPRRHPRRRPSTMGGRRLRGGRGASRGGGPGQGQ